MRRILASSELDASVLFMASRGKESKAGEFRVHVLTCRLESLEACMSTNDAGRPYVDDNHHGGFDEPTYSRKGISEHTEPENWHNP